MITTKPLQRLIALSSLFALILIISPTLLSADPVRLLKPGMTLYEAEAVMGEPGKIKEIERHIFNRWGHVVVKGEKIDDIRILKGSGGYTPLPFREGREVSGDINPLRYLRIGNPYSMIAEVAGTPDRIAAGTDLHYDRGHVIVETENGLITQVHRDERRELERLDWIKLNFSPLSLLIMNITIAFIMFGVALGIKPEHFRLVIKEPKSLILGIFSQFLALPALTFVLIHFLQPTASVALGMILVAACPGGNVSNFMSSMAKGNAALSISLTAFATTVAVFMTPVNFAFWGKLYSETSSMVIPIRIDFLEILRTVLLLLGIPVVAGIWFSRKFPAITKRIINPVKKISMIIFIMFIAGALFGNLEFFKSYIHLVLFIVLGHNALALLTGFLIGTIGKVPKRDRRSLTIETGIQNSGLGLVLIFNPRLFDGLGGMAFIAAWWGIWHIISGLVLAYLWSRKPLPAEEPEAIEVNVSDK
jgi:bile acid:Na+ symporter, BASS family